MWYYSFLETLHANLSPQTYLEIGIRNGGSLAIANCRAVGVDPAYNLTAEIDGDVALFRTSSDEYFARDEPLAATGGQPFDLAFIDGLHIFEFALRDFIYAERHASTKTAIIFDDVFPRTVEEAARVRNTNGWTGDVYPMIEVLAHYRPELFVLPVGTQPTGLLLVMGLDPSNTVLADNYTAILAEYRRPDPQPVPAVVLDRLSMLNPQRVLDATFWEILATADRQTPADQIRSALAERLGAELGSAFGEAHQHRHRLAEAP